MNTPNATTPRVLLAALCYFGALFALGFACGVIRVPILEPRFGELGALAFEAPVMLVGMIVAAPAIARRFGVPPGAGPGLLMGFAALAMLLSVEVLVGVWARDMTFSGTVDRFATPAGMLSGVLYLLFALVPGVPRRRP